MAERWTHTLRCRQAHISELQHQVRARDDTLSAHDMSLQHVLVVVQGIEQQHQLLEAAIRASVMTSSAERKRHLHEMTRMEEMLSLLRSVCSGKEEELSRAQAEVADAKREASRKDQLVQEEIERSKQQVRSTRDHALELLQEHRRRSVSPPDKSVAKPSTAQQVLRAPSGDAGGHCSEGEVECQLRLEALEGASPRTHATTHVRMHLHARAQFTRTRSQ